MQREDCLFYIIMIVKYIGIDNDTRKQSRKHQEHIRSLRGTPAYVADRPAHIWLQKKLWEGIIFGRCLLAFDSAQILMKGIREHEENCKQQALPERVLFGTTGEMFPENNLK